jgi:hypothetical protein
MVVEDTVVEEHPGKERPDRPSLGRLGSFILQMSPICLSTEIPFSVGARDRNPENVIT